MSVERVFQVRLLIFFLFIWHNYRMFEFNFYDSILIWVNFFCLGVGGGEIVRSESHDWKDVPTAFVYFFFFFFYSCLTESILWFRFVPELFFVLFVRAALEKVGRYFFFYCVFGFWVFFFYYIFDGNFFYYQSFHFRCKNFIFEQLMPESPNKT